MSDLRDKAERDKLRPRQDVDRLHLLDALDALDALSLEQQDSGAFMAYMREILDSLPCKHGTKHLGTVTAPMMWPEAIGCALEFAREQERTEAAAREAARYGATLDVVNRIFDQLVSQVSSHPEKWAVDQAREEVLSVLAKAELAAELATDISDRAREIMALAEDGKKWRETSEPLRASLQAWIDKGNTIILHKGVYDELQRKLTIAEEKARKWDAMAERILGSEDDMRAWLDERKQSWGQLEKERDVLREENERLRAKLDQLHANTCDGHGACSICPLLGDRKDDSWNNDPFPHPPYP